MSDESKVHVPPLAIRLSNPHSVEADGLPYGRVKAIGYNNGNEKWEQLNHAAYAVTNLFVFFSDNMSSLGLNNMSTSRMFAQEVHPYHDLAILNACISRLARYGMPYEAPQGDLLKLFGTDYPRWANRQPIDPLQD